LIILLQFCNRITFIRWQNIVKRISSRDKLKIFCSLWGEEQQRGLSDPPSTHHPENPVLGFFLDETEPNPTPGEGSGFIVFFSFFSHALTFNGQFFFFLSPFSYLPPAFPFLPLSPPFSRSSFLFLSLGPLLSLVFLVFSLFLLSSFWFVQLRLRVSSFYFFGLCRFV